MKKKSTYEKLREKYTDEEIADAFIFPSDDGTPEERAEDDRKFSEWLKQHRKNMKIEKEMKLAGKIEKLLNGHFHTVTPVTISGDLVSLGILTNNPIEEYEPIEKYEIVIKKIIPAPIK